MTVADLKSRLGPGEYYEWVAYDKNTPIGPERWEVLIAQIPWVIANIHRKRGGKTFKLREFTPFLRIKTLVRQSCDQMYYTLMAWAGWHNKSVPGGEQLPPGEESE